VDSKTAVQMHMALTKTAAALPISKTNSGALACILFHFLVRSEKLVRRKK
jgi:hypothetical protein